MPTITLLTVFPLWSLTVNVKLTGVPGNCLGTLVGDTSNVSIQLSELITKKSNSLLGIGIGICITAIAGQACTTTFPEVAPSGTLTIISLLFQLLYSFIS